MWGLASRCLEVPVPLSSTTTFQQDYFLFVFCKLAEKFACITVIRNGPDGYINVFILAVRTEGTGMTSTPSVSCKDVTGVF